MTTRLTRRRFLQGTAAIAAGATIPYTLTAAQPQPPERLRLGIIGVAGRGGENLNGVSHENIVALCDVDTNRAAGARQKFPKAQFFEDYRRLIDQKNVEAVVISTPDHSHALPALLAMQAGKHVYLEKPLAHNVREVRLLMEAAARHKVVTQMGTQIHAGENYRRVVEIVQAGTLGRVRRVRVWVNTQVPGCSRAVQQTKPPQGLNYDLWLGAAPHRHYHESHLHFRWRWWWDFGGGVLADMACHYVDLPHWALHLTQPATVAASGRVTYKGDNTVPDRLQVDYEYPARGDAPPVHLTWYHGVSGPDLAGKVTYAGYPAGVLFEGEKGNLLAGYNSYQLLPAERFQGFEPPRPTIARSVGHHREWLQAIRGVGATTCPFAYSGALTTAVLLGNVAYRCGGKIHWDAKAGTVTNNKDAAQYLRREYRKGWTVG